jgi:hypothetical protein
VKLASSREVLPSAWIDYRHKVKAIEMNQRDMIANSDRSWLFDRGATFLEDVDGI